MLQIVEDHFERHLLTCMANSVMLHTHLLKQCQLGEDIAQAYVMTISIHGKDQYALTFDKCIIQEVYSKSIHALLLFVDVEALVNNVSDVNRTNGIYWTFMCSDNGIDNITYCVISNVIDIQNSNDTSYLQNNGQINITITLHLQYIIVMFCYTIIVLVMFMPDMYYIIFMLTYSLYKY